MIESHFVLIKLYAVYSPKKYCEILDRRLTGGQIVVVTTEIARDTTACAV